MGWCGRKMRERKRRKKTLHPSMGFEQLLGKLFAESFRRQQGED